MRGVIFACLGLALVPGAVLAQGYDGLYRPAGDFGTGWNCQSVGMDGGAVAVMDGKLMGVENTCDLGDPVAVEGLPATLFEMTCMAEGTSYTERVMLMTSDSGIYVIRSGFVAEWVRCP